MVWARAEHSPLCTLQAEVWDLDMLRSNHSTWPVDIGQIKQGFIVVRGHSTVRLQLTVSPALPPYVPHLFPYPQLPRHLYSILPMGPLSTETLTCGAHA